MHCPIIFWNGGQVEVPQTERQDQGRVGKENGAEEGGDRAHAEEAEGHFHLPPFAELHPEYLLI